jgi:diguanylate cyclase (GGDEF)-like protein
MDEGLTANSIRAIIAAHDGSIDALCESGGLVTIRDGIVAPWPHNAQLSALGGTSLFQSKDGSLWIGSSKGLNRYHDGTMALYQGVFTRYFISAISEDEESVIVADSESRLQRIKNKEVLPFTIRGQPTPFMQGGEHSLYVMAMDEDREGTRWFGTNHGLYKLSRGASPLIGWKVPLDLQITSIYDDGDGNLWLGGRTPGLIQFRVRDGRVTRYAKQDGLFDGYVSRVLPDATGHLWISTEDGIYKALRSELNDFADGRLAHIASIHYGLADGMKTTAVSDPSSQPGGATSHERLWFATRKGLVVVDPDHLQHNNQIPPVVIETVVTDGTLRPFQQSFSIQPGLKSLEFHYTGLSFRVPERVRFKCQLVGYDRDWIDAGSRRVAYYTNLSPGNYRFRVIAANDDGVWNLQGASVNVSLKPHYYQTRWFYLLCIVLAALTLLLAHRRKTQQIRARSEELSRIVFERTAELEKSRQDLEQIAHFDALTTLPNRRMFNETFSRMQERTQRHGDGLSLILIDFDKFKQINDTYGHDAGDAFLVEASVRLRAAVRTSDCVARLGGDEFAILLGGEADLEGVCNRIIQSFGDAILFKDAAICASASVGAAVFPDHGRTREELYKSADLALYKVKQSGKNNWIRYSPEVLAEPVASRVSR